MVLLKGPMGWRFRISEVALYSISDLAKLEPKLERAERRGRDMNQVYMYRGTSLIGKRRALGPYSSPVPRAVSWSWEEGGGSCERGTPTRHLQAVLLHASL